MPTSSGPRPNFQQNGNSLRCSHSEVSQRNVHCYKGIVWYAMTLINKLFLIDHQQTTPVKAKHLADVFSSFDFQSHSRTYLINLITTVTRNVDGQQANIKIAKFYLVSSRTAPVCCQTVNVFSWKESLLQWPSWDNQSNYEFPSPSRRAEAELIWRISTFFTL